MFDRSQEKIITDPTFSSELRIKGIYILSITAEALEAEQMIPIVHMADDMLRNKNATFVAMMEKASEMNTPIEIANIQYAGPIFHTPQTMQESLASWIRDKYNVIYQPILWQTFFPQRTRDSQGRDNFFLFYFDA